MTIRTDATRLRVPSREPRAYRNVVPRQGQVLLDTDFSQESEALLDRIERETADVLNSAGRLVYPADEPGFQITADGGAADFKIGEGHGYLDGWLLQNAAAVTLSTQPHPRTSDAVGAPTIIAIKALVRHVDPVEDSGLADRALGDAQASGRALIDWQVFPMGVPGGQLDCATAEAELQWQALIAASSGKMSVHKQAAASATDPCSLTPGGGYTRLENLLYRIEVHGGRPVPGLQDIDGPRFGADGLVIKFSRRNASVMARIIGRDGTSFNVEPAALDSRAWFAPGSYAEIVNIHDDVDPRAAVQNERMFRVSVATADRIQLKATASELTATGMPTTLEATAAEWFLRLWDALPDDEGTAAVEITGGVSKPIELGDGLSVQFHDSGGALFRRGDHWSFAARADGSVEWPGIAADAPEPVTPHGPEIRYAILAIATATDPPAYENCSIPFGSLTDRLLFYRGGDGQSVLPDLGQPFVDLPQPLRVAVMRGRNPVAGAVVRWFAVAGAPDTQVDGQPCTATQPVTKVTGANGIVEVPWAIDRGKLHETHRVVATLALSPVDDPGNAIEFNATFSTARATGYEPGQCAHLTNVDNVQDALDTLCANLGQDKPQKTLRLNRITLHGTQPTELIERGMILNGLEVAFDAFIEAIEFGIEARGLGELRFDELDPVAEITLDLPYPSTDPDRLYWSMVSHGQINRPFGFKQIRLDGHVRPDEEVLRWIPSPAAQMFLRAQPAHLFGQALGPGPERRRLEDLGWGNRPTFAKIPCRLRLRSALIWAEDRDTGVPTYLNAEHLGGPPRPEVRPLMLKETDPQRAADLEMFIFLAVRQG